MPTASKIKIEKSKFLTFLKFITLTKEITNKEALFSVKENGFSTLLLSQDKTLAIRASFETPLIDLGDVGITDLPSFVKYVESMPDEFNISFNKNKLILNGDSTKISVVLQNSEYIVNKLEDSKFESVNKTLEGGSKLELTNDCLLSLIEKFNILSGEDLYLKGEGNKLYLLTKNYQTDAELETSFELNYEINKNFEILVSKYLITIFTCCQGIPLTLELANNESPNAIGLTLKTDYCSVEYILALKLKPE